MCWHRALFAPRLEEDTDMGRHAARSPVVRSAVAAVIALRLGVATAGCGDDALDLPAVEDELGRDLDDADLTEHGEAPYIVAEQVETES
jgi:hypothetical protein